MELLHGTFFRGAFAVWGETEAHSHEDETVWPYAIRSERLWDLLSSIGLQHAQKRDLVGWLPTSNGTPLPSSPLFGEAATKDGMRLSPWNIPVFVLESNTAPEFLKIEESKIDSGIFYGNDLQYWSRSLRFVFRLLSHQKFIPWLQHQEARWMPLLSGEDHALFREMARSMPAVCRAFSDQVLHAPNDSAEKVLLDFVSFFLDYLIRESCVQVPVEGSTTHDLWLSALQQRFAGIEKSEDDLNVLRDSIHNWAEPVLRLANFDYRLAFRLEEPTAKKDYWFIRYFLQKQDEPSLLIPAGNLWRKKRSALQILKDDFERAHQNLLSELVQAGRIDPWIQMSLHRPSPEGYQTDTKGAWEFLETKAWILQSAGYGVLLPSWWGQKKAQYRLRLRGKATSKKTFSASIGTDTLIEFDWKFAVGDQQLTYKELMALAKLKQPLVKFRGKWITLRPEEIASAIEFWRSKESGTLFDLLKLSSGAEMIGELPVEAVDAEGWLADFLFNFQEHAKFEMVDPPTTLEGTLRPYQQRGLSWLHFMRRFGIGACLADDMGLGKTVQTIALLLKDLAPGRKALVICPTSVVGNWQREFSRFAPGLAVKVHHGVSRKKGDDFMKQLETTDVIVSSFSLLIRDFETLQRLKWRAVVLDEAQNIKNAETKQARAARGLQADYKVALTGTPIENNVGELWSIMEFLNRGLLGSKTDFQRKYFLPIHKEGNAEAMEDLKRITGPFVLRRVKSDPDVISDLPKKMEMKVFCNLTREQGSLYAAAVRELEKEIEELEGIQRKGKILATITKLKQICNHPAHFLRDASSLEGRSGKLARLTEMLEEISEASERSLIFTQFAEMGELLRAHLQNYFGREAAFLHGGVPRRKREELVDRFNSPDSGPPFFILSLKAGGTGLNLTGANHVFHFDRWWNPAVEDQATDRAYRIGQTKNVQVHKFVCVGTLEERIDQILEKKKQVASTILGTGESWLTELSTEEIKSLIALSQDAVAV